VGALGLDVRVGLHTGECEVLGDDVGGMAVHIAARVAGLARPGEVLASGTAFGTVVGSDLSFEDRGSHDLKGVPGRWPIFALDVD
jgi:class 3 adenylate cyclase